MVNDNGKSEGHWPDEPRIIALNPLLFIKVTGTDFVHPVSGFVVHFDVGLTKLNKCCFSSSLCKCAAIRRASKSTIRLSGPEYFGLVLESFTCCFGDLLVFVSLVEISVPVLFRRLFIANELFKSVVW